MSDIHFAYLDEQMRPISGFDLLCGIMVAENTYLVG